MQQREDGPARITARQSERTDTTSTLAETEQRRDVTLAEIDAEMADTTTRRESVAGGLPADLLTLYDKLRASSGGVGAAVLHRGRCDGCHLQLNTTDLNRLRDAPDDEVLRCEECRRILVRTPESGL